MDWDPVPWVKQYYNPIRDAKIEPKEDADIKLGYCIEDVPKLTIKEDGEFKVIKDFTTVYNILKEYRDQTDKIEITYPESYIMSLEEYDNIITLDYKFLNVHRDYEEGYKPSFPKRMKKEKEDKFIDWEL